MSDLGVVTDVKQMNIEWVQDVNNYIYRGKATFTNPSIANYLLGSNAAGTANEYKHLVGGPGITISFAPQLITISNDLVSNPLFTLGSDPINYSSVHTALHGVTIDGALNTFLNIPNASLDNSSVVIGSDTLSLGGTLTALNGVTIDAALNSLLNVPNTLQITGFVSSPGIISGADTILSAIEKLDGNSASIPPFTITSPQQDDRLVYDTGSGSFINSQSMVMIDQDTSLLNLADNTKSVLFDISNLPTSTTRTMSFPNATVVLNGCDVATGKIQLADNAQQTGGTSTATVGVLTGKPGSTNVTDAAGWVIVNINGTEYAMPIFQL